MQRGIEGHRRRAWRSTGVSATSTCPLRPSSARNTSSPCVFTVLQLAAVYVLAAALSEGIPGDRLEQFALLTIGAMAGTAIGLVISAFANTPRPGDHDRPTGPGAAVDPGGGAGAEAAGSAEKLAKVAVSGYWLTEAMKSVFIAADGPIRVINARTGVLMDMIAEPADLGAAIVAVHALVFLLIAYLVTLAAPRGTESWCPRLRLLSSFRTYLTSRFLLIV